MSKNTFMALTILLAYLIILTNSIRIVSSQEVGVNPTIEVIDPHLNSTFSDKMPLVFRVTCNATSPSIRWIDLDIFYKIDDFPFTDPLYSRGWYNYPGNPPDEVLKTYAEINTSVDISKLRNGVHTLLIEAKGNYNINNVQLFPYDICFSPIIFSVFTPPPSVQLLAPQNKSYEVRDILLSFTVNEVTSWVGFSLDSLQNETLNGNMFLSSVLEGSHSLVLYANDTVGNMGKSDIVFFTVNTKPSPSSTLTLSPTPKLPPIVSPTLTPIASSSPEITLEPTPTEYSLQADNFAPEIIILALAVMAVVLVLVYFKRRGIKRE
jgi:hypothetical protein